MTYAHDTTLHNKLSIAVQSLEQAQDLFGRNVATLWDYEQAVNDHIKEMRAMMEWLAEKQKGQDAK